VIACGALAARAVNHVVQARYLSERADAALPPRVPDRARKQAEDQAEDQAEAAAPRSKDGTRAAERNMFCSDCAPDQPGPEPPAGSGDDVPVTSLPIELVATSLAQPKDASLATIRNTASGHQGAFFAGDSIPGAGPIEHIRGTSVLFRNLASGQLEQVSLLATAPAQPRVSRAASPDAAAYADHVRQVDDTTFEVDRNLVTKLISNPTQLGARVSPAQQDGQFSGFRVMAVRPGSALAAIGIRSGDVLQSINGHPMTMDPDRMLELYGKLKQASDLSVSISRRGQLLAMNYRVR
jgi:type II secretion system protein C